MTFLTITIGIDDAEGDVTLENEDANILLAHAFNSLCRDKGLLKDEAFIRDTLEYLRMRIGSYQPDWVGSF